MFWITGQNRASCTRSSAILASQRLGPRDERGGGKNSACGTEGVVRTSMLNTSSDERRRGGPGSILPRASQPASAGHLTVPTPFQEVQPATSGVGELPGFAISSGFHRSH